MAESNSEPRSEHDRYMIRAIQLARRGWYTTLPNPRVGCVLVKQGQVVGEGWHQQAGAGHAEVNALAAAGNRAEGATAYVSLEPCSHHGKTPPCCDALINAKVSRVVVAMQDPNPRVSGNGMQALRAAGIEVIEGVQSAAAEALNPGFIQRMRQQRPRLRAKMAMSLDGRTAMASGESQWITGPEARRQVQRLRAESGAVITGVGSILSDDSALTVRAAELGFADNNVAAEVAAQARRRVVLDSQLRTPTSARVLQTPGAMIATVCTDKEKQQALKNVGAELVVCGQNQQVDLSLLLDELAQRECNDVLLETGAGLAGAFLAAGLIDELIVFMAPSLLGSLARPLFDLPITTMAEKVSLNISDVRAVGQDWQITAKPIYGESD